MELRTTAHVVCLALATGGLLACTPQGGDAPPPPPGLETRFADASADPIEPIAAVSGLDARKVALGKRLFGDPILSGDGAVSCLSCHQFEKGLSDGQVVSHGPGGRSPTKYNSPTLFNLAHNYKFNWTGKYDTLEDQIQGPMSNPAVMNSKWPDVLRKVGADAGYRRDFEALYLRQGITEASIVDALVTYERSLSTPDSRFDKYLRGDEGALTADEKTGYELFRSHGCVSCHQGMNVGGNLLERFGAVNDYFDPSAVKPSDLGRFNDTKRKEDEFVFRVPSLRNVAKTAPYFHDGSAATLEAAVTVMANYQLGRPLSDDQTQLLVAFLGTLTGEYEGKVLP